MGVIEKGRRGREKGRQSIVLGSVPSTGKGWVKLFFMKFSFIYEQIYGRENLAFIHEQSISVLMVLEEKALPCSSRAVTTVAPSGYLKQCPFPTRPLPPSVNTRVCTVTHGKEEFQRPQDASWEQLIKAASTPFNTK